MIFLIALIPVERSIQNAEVSNTFSPLNNLSNHTSSDFHIHALSHHDGGRGIKDETRPPEDIKNKTGFEKHITHITCV